MWPIITAAAVTNHFSESKETIKGYARKTRSGLRSTKLKQADKIDDNNDNKIPTVRYHDIFTRVYCINNEDALHNIHSNQTGHSPKKSSKGNQYVVVLVPIDSGGILIAAMKVKTAGKMIRACQSLIDRLNEQEFIPSITCSTMSVPLNSRQQSRRIT